VSSGGRAKAETEPPHAPSALQRLEQEPSRFSLDQAAAVMAPGKDPAELSYRTLSRLGAPGGEVVQARPDRGEIVTSTFGLIGPGGVLPRHYTAWTDAESRKRSTALHAFLDMLATRFTGLFVKAGSKHRVTRDPTRAQHVLAAAFGLGTPHLADALSSPMEALLYHAGGLASGARGAERLRGMLSEEAGADVRIIEFAGGWTRLEPREQTRLAASAFAGLHARLDTDAVAGMQVWDASARFLVNLGPMPLAKFKALLPGAPLHTRLAELTRLHVGLEQDFAINPILQPEEVPALMLTSGDDGAAQLGWTSWLTHPRPRNAPACDAILRAQS
jgi:type VI secretion system protein ImpH